MKKYLSKAEIIPCKHSALNLRVRHLFMSSDDVTPVSKFHALFVHTVRNAMHIFRDVVNCFLSSEDDSSDEDENL